MKRAAKTATKRRRARTFTDGLTLGFAAPSMLLSGALMGLLQPSKKSSIASAWKDVGQFIESSSDAHRAARGGRERRRA